MAQAQRGDSPEIPSIRQDLAEDLKNEAKAWWRWARNGAIVVGVLAGIVGFVLMSWKGLLYGAGGGAAVGAVASWFLYLQLSADM